MINHKVLTLAENLQKIYLENNLTLATAESCTGGLLGAILTSIPGSSSYYYGGAIVYANHAKEIFAAVDGEIIKTQGAVSSEVAKKLALGIRAKLKAAVGVGITGIAGPAGGTPDKPVGLVYVGIADTRGVKVYKFHFSGNRQEIREKTVIEVLKLLIQNCFDN